MILARKRDDPPHNEGNAFMPIPPNSINDVLPPYIGKGGPGGPADEMSPYAVTAQDVVERFCVSNKRAAILTGWLQHRAALRALGFGRGFQWLDGMQLCREQKAQ